MPTIYLSPADVVWVKDSDHTLVINRVTGESWILLGVEEMIWNWASMGYSYAQVAQMVRLLFHWSYSEAIPALEKALKTWCDAGIITVAEER